MGDDAVLIPVLIIGGAGIALLAVIAAIAIWAGRHRPSTPGSSSPDNNNLDVLQHDSSGSWD